jgi:P27 family predicted phage terminase small subunit
MTHSQPKKAGRRVKVATPDRPKWLTPYGRAIWNQVVKELEPLGLLSKADQVTLAGFCDAATFAKKARDEVVKDGVTMFGQHGELVRHPAYVVWQQSMAKVESLGRVLALNPSARLRLLAELEEPDDDDLLD